jgi:hypothetical protein
VVPEVGLEPTRREAGDFESLELLMQVLSTLGSCWIDLTVSGDCFGSKLSSLSAGIANVELTRVWTAVS